MSGGCRRRAGRQPTCSAAVPPVDTLLFSIALAVGLSPELLPAILSVNLVRGAELMARRGVLVRRLSAIENLGSMNVLCTDKTGTLTEGVVQVEGAYDGYARLSPDVLELAACNAALETGVASPLDDAIAAARRPDLSAVRKLAEVPFDFTRKRVTIVVQSPQGIRLITKGAFESVLDICTQAADGGALDDTARARLGQQYRVWTGRGIRVLAVAARGRTSRRPTAEATSTRCGSWGSSRSSIDRGKESRTPCSNSRRWAYRSSSSPATADWSPGMSRHSSACVRSA
jgi:magnesium-transporting ATPase (P-type)